MAKLLFGNLRHLANQEEGAQKLGLVLLVSANHRCVRLKEGTANRLAVICPPHLAEQWQSELDSKFHIDAVIVGAGTAARLERGLPYGRSLFEQYDHVVVSIDFIKSDRRRDDFVRACPELVVVDEAHGATSGAERSRQQRHHLVKQLSKDASRHLILVTATPHSGNEGAFRSLIGLLDASLEELREDLTGKENEKRPETSFAEAQQAQERADTGDPAVQWRTDAAEVAIRYAKEVLGWPDPIAGVMPTDDADTVSVSLSGPIASCTGAACEEPQPQQIGVHLNLGRIVRSGEGGIWSVTELGPMSEPIGEDRPRIGGWPEDADGDGTISDTGAERIPALIRTAGDHGVTGYVRYVDLEGPQPSNPEEASATSGQERVIPVYAEDGFTVVDWYTLSSDEGSPSPPPGG